MAFGKTPMVVGLMLKQNCLIMNDGGTARFFVFHRENYSIILREWIARGGLAWVIIMP